ncbi:ABC transporter permease [Streptomyces platensis]|uniref:ABC transporter permease n=1 Tax=Streptomyces platensis TaxID=58346 RepID=UPI002E81CD19|nr:ABC transporter permease [Streptomyces platensis]WUB80487.1 ABC transporter permease [Streptomyces platensis]
MTTTAHLGAHGAGPAAGDPGGTREAGGRGRLGGLVWLVRRQHRLFFGVLLAAVAAGAVWCAVLRGRAAAFIDAHHLDGCSMISLVPRCDGTQDAVNAFRSAYGRPLQLAEAGLLLLPVLIGLFLSAPLIARELEAGTHKLVLTQSVGPLRWLAAKTALPALVVLTATTALSAVFAWMWQVVGDEVSGSYWYSTLGFASLGPVPVAYSLLALAIGVLAGLRLRRTVLTMGVTLGAMVVVQVVLGQIRPYLLPTRSTEFGPKESAQLPDNAWPVGQGYYTRSGAHLPDTVCESAGNYEGCLRTHHVVGQYMDHHPASHHWPLAWIESGIVLALTAVLTVIAFRVMRRRHG